MTVTFIKLTWVDQSAPSLSAANLNRIEDGIDDVVTELNTHTADTDVHFTVASIGLASVATSGLYSDLSGTPTIPSTMDDLGDGATYVRTENNYDDAAVTKLAGVAVGAEVNVNADWNASSGDAQILNKPTLAAVATSGSYADLSGTPSIPSTVDDLSDGTTYVRSENNYTDADAAIVASVESGADVTDAANVDAAGAVMNSDTSTAAMGFVVDEDNMVSNSATKVPTQQSVKAYVDTEIAGVSPSGDATSIQGTNVDSSVGSPSDGDILVYRVAGGDFVLEAKPASGSNPALTDVTDVTITTVADNDILAYDQTSGDWINQSASEAGFSTVATTGAYSDLSGTPTIPTALGDLSGTSDNVTEGSTNLFLTTSERSAIAGIPSALTDLSGDSDDVTEGSVNLFMDTTEQAKLGYITITGAKDLDGIEAGADVTDAANVSAAGALMKSGGTMTGDITAGNNDVLSMKTATFNAEYDNSTSGTSKTIDWNNGQKQKITLSDNCTFTFTDLATGVGNLVLKIVQDATGSRTATFPIGVYWEGGTAPTLSTGANAVDIISMYFDGTYYYGVAGLNFS